MKWMYIYTSSIIDILEKKDPLALNWKKKKYDVTRSVNSLFIDEWVSQYLSFIFQF